jgi:hypothetical protein
MFFDQYPRLTLISLLMIVSSGTAAAQSSPLPDAPRPQTQTDGSPAQSGDNAGYGKHHILWVIPNYRSDESASVFKPLTPRQKFKLAFNDSFDPTAFLVAGVFAGSAMAQHQYPSFGQGAAGFGKYYGGAFADQAIGNVMTEALLPIALHQDPRYFTKGSGGFLKRTGYAMSREVITRNDDGRNHFNTSELLGNAIAAGISNAYYPSEDVSLGRTFNKWGQQIGLDTGFNIMKEFWPDIRRKLLRQ